MVKGNQRGPEIKQEAQSSETKLEHVVQQTCFSTAAQRGEKNKHIQVIIQCYVTLCKASITTECQGRP